MDLQLAESLSKEVSKKEEDLDKIEDAGGEDFISEKSPQWMAIYREKIQIEAKLYLVVFEGTKIQFNEPKTAFRIVTKENRGTKFW
ncbi:hypothetical protein LCGC14_1179180 [marine sediment metagenome]|uniref:Uncharacterized protein n=1 Tax=marine sediment metagenome TaxID=412755 RepID=A0A0F9G0N8_9ZZZZ